MGRAVRKDSENYNKYESYLRIVRSETAISAKNNYENNYNNLNNNNNNDDYIDLKKNKIKSYLDDLRSRSAKTAKPEGVTMKTAKDRYTIQEAAELLGVSVRTLELREKEGRIVIIREKNKRRFITSEVIQAALNGEVYEKHESEISENENNEVCDPVDNSDTEIIEPEKYSPGPQNNFVTREELNSYTSAINNFTNTLADIKCQQELERQENRVIIDELRNENAQLVKKVEHLVGRVSRVDEFIEMWRQEHEQNNRPWWRKLFSR